MNIPAEPICLWALLVTTVIKKEIFTMSYIYQDGKIVVRDRYFQEMLYHV